MPTAETAMWLTVWTFGIALLFTTINRRALHRLSLRIVHLEASEADNLRLSLQPSQTGVREYLVSVASETPWYVDDDKAVILREDGHTAGHDGVARRQV